MKLTKKQIEAKQAITPSGWDYDWEYAVIHSEHTLKRNIDLDGNAERILQARIFYQSFYNWRTRETTLTPTMNISIWQKKQGGAYCSYGLGKFRTVGAPQPKKNYKTLCEIARRITDNELLEITNNDEAIKFA